jgi:acyl CoA:acetate/3-ketoacid CoA transferase alpha subunit
MVGGFMGVGTPERLIDELVRQRKRDLTIIANDTAVPGPVYLRLLIQIKRAQKFEHMTFRGIERCNGEVE